MSVDERAREEDTAHCKDSLQTTHKYVPENWTVWLSWIGIDLSVPLKDIQ